MFPARPTAAVCPCLASAGICSTSTAAAGPANAKTPFAFVSLLLPVSYHDAMPRDDINDDDYVANLLKQDAKNSTTRYSMVGLDALIPKRSQLRAPKPNTRFLRHIIRETDTHNAALLAKEAEESRARLRELERQRRRNEEGERRREQGRLTPPDGDEGSRRHAKRRRIDHSDDDADGKARSRRKDYSDDERGDTRRSRRDEHRSSKEHRSRTVKEGENDRRKAHRKDEDDGGENRNLRSSHSRQHRDRRRRYDSESDEGHHKSRRKDDSHRKDESHRKHRRRKSYSRSRSRSRSASPHSHKHHKSSRSQHRHRSSKHRSRSPDPKRSTRKRKSPNPQSDSDPLEAIVGPLPPPPQPVVRSKGRGAYKANSMAMDERFSSGYDPSVDVHLKSDAEDDWGDALEALRDRQKWKQQGADRLRHAGFTDEQVKKWEKGDEKNEEDVVWTKKGEGREWDRGKVVDDDGDVDLKADWGRLK
ncbi:hypothetical protein BCR34DRAFT_565128 [Clohesyomyces aquaticus]|uniref:Pre-mRNA-splicing factor 38B n=1 Tax=Clohesyomyces aquaticus TaxID=1231657 RepID=A0A1Y1ZMN1_9PLEO|nr:hypothetical protein BCR34DRAFT_565128 [Clohesyomyces aquaticus]